MSRITITLYSFFQYKKVFLFVLVTLFLGAGIWSAFHLEYEEDITKVLPSDERSAEFNRVLEQVRLTDKIMFSVSGKNKGTSELTIAGEALVQGLENLKPELISDITFKLDDNRAMEVFDDFYANIPLYLDSADYEALDSLITEENIAKTLSAGYRNLLSPAGSFLKKTFLRDPLSITPKAIQKLQSLKVDDRFRIENDVIFSSDGHQLMIYAQPTFSSKKTSENGKLAEELAILKNTVEKSFGVDVHYFGTPLVAAGNASRIKTDINIIMSAVGIFLFVFLLFFYRNPFYYFTLIVPAAIGAAAGFSALYLIKGSASAIAMGVGGMVLGITIDYSLHVFTHFRTVKDIRKLLEDVTGGMLLSSFTTVCAFYCLLFTNSEALRDLGIFAGTGVFTAAIASLIVLPHMLGKPKIDTDEVRVNWIEKLTGYPYHKNIPVISVGVIFSVVCLVFFMKPDFEGNPENFSYMPPELQEALLIQNNGSDAEKKSIFFVANGKTVDEMLSRAEQNAEKIERLKKQGVVLRVSGPGEVLLSQERQAQKIKDWNTFWTADKKENVKQYVYKTALQLGFKEGAFSQFGTMLDKEYEARPASEFEAIRKSFLSEFITENEDGYTGIYILDVNKDQKSLVYEELGEEPGIFMFDRQKMASDLIEIVRVDLDTLVGISSVVVFIILLISYGRIELATLTYIPLILSWVWTLGFMGILGLKFNIVNIIICTFVFGLGNDYCIFIMNGLLQDYRYGTNNLKSYKTSVFLSAFTTMLGVGAMGLSGHPALRSIAIMGVAGIGTVLFLSYAILPWLFHLVITSKTRRGMQPLTVLNILPTIWAWMAVLTGFLNILPIGLLISAMIFIPKKYRTRAIRFLLMWWARFYIFVVFFGRKKVYNTGNEKFDKPGILVANHQSFIDVVYLFSLSPRISLTANSRIYNNPIFGTVSRMAGFLDISQGVENISGTISKLIKEGNIVAIFPEGTRSTDYKIHRFHKGAFKVAEEAGADIIPITLYGTGDFLHKGEFWGRWADIHIEILPRVKFSDTSYGTNYQERTKAVVSLMRQSYEYTKENRAGTIFHRDRLIQNFIYLDPVLEWYVRIKIKFEGYYSVFHRNLPKHGKIYDLGCGYGLMSYTLLFMSEKREMIGCDYDSEKVETANHRFSKNERINFTASDLTVFEPDFCDGIVISDVLHYLLPEQQLSLLERCVSKLNQGGVLLVKDADSSDKKHKKTLQTENMSTEVIKFNKTQNTLHFFNHTFLASFAESKGLVIEVVNQSRNTSNKVWKISRI